MDQCVRLATDAGKKGDEKVMSPTVKTILAQSRRQFSSVLLQLHCIIQVSLLSTLTAALYDTSESPVDAVYDTNKSMLARHTLQMSDSPT